MTNHYLKAVLFIVVTLMAGCQSKPVDPRGPPTVAAPAQGGTTHVNPHFRIALPVNWAVVQSRPEPTAYPGSVMEGAVALKATGPEGYYLDVWFECPGTELSSDSYWRVVSEETGRAVLRVDERNDECNRGEWIKECEKSGSDMCYCAVGDGRLDIWAFYEGKHLYANSNGLCINLGNVKREDADRAVLRSIVKTFHLEGPVDAPKPKLPDARSR